MCPTCWPSSRSRTAVRQPRSRGTCSADRITRFGRLPDVAGLLSGGTFYDGCLETTTHPSEDVAPMPGHGGAAGLLGRAREQAELDDALSAASKGDHQVVLVAGDAGAGKTTLVA